MMIYGVSMFICAFKISADTRILLKREDTTNLIGNMGAATIAITTTILMSYTDNLYLGIPVGVLVGEIFLLVILGSKIGGISFFKTRLKFLVKTLPVFIVSMLPYLYFGSTLLSMILCTGIYITLILISYRKLIFDASFLKRTKS